MSENREHEHHDGCLCDMKIEEHELTPDHELPEAKGGVAKERNPPRKSARANAEESA